MDKRDITTCQECDFYRVEKKPSEVGEFCFNPKFQIDFVHTWPDPPYCRDINLFGNCVGFCETTFPKELENWKAL